VVFDNTRSYLELLYNISRDLATELDLRLVLQRVLYLSLENIGGERGSIVVMDEAGKPVDAAIIYGSKIHSHTTQQLRDTVEKGMAGWVVRHHKPVLIDDTSQDARWLHRPDEDNDTNGKSAICAPILVHDKLVGVLTIVHPKPHFFNQDHLLLMQAISDQAGVAILNARLYHESQMQARIMTALAQNAAALNQSLRQEEVLPQILEQTATALNVETVAMALIDQKTRELVFNAVSGEQADLIRGIKFPYGHGIAGRVARTGKVQFVSSISEETREFFPGALIRSFACAPIISKGKIIGVLEAINPRDDNFESSALPVLSIIGSLAGTAINNAQLYEQVDSTKQRYLDLFEDSIDPILITNWHGHILESNRQLAKNLGYTDDELKSIHINQVHEINQEKLGENYTKVTSTEPITYESVMRTQSGHEIPVQVYVRRINYEGADNLQWILRDITERKNLDDLRNDLVAMIYHDLRSPLANVIASLDIMNTMLTNGENESLHGLVSIADRSANRMQRLINSLLDTYRLEAGQPIANRKIILPENLLNAVVDAEKSTLETKGQKISQTIGSKLPAISVDEDMMRRVLLNLLENASKFSPSDSLLEVGLDSNESQVIFWVKDHGTGIPPEDQERIFEKFSRLQLTKATKGLGLGLSFCRTAVTAHEGKIWVESKMGEGSIFFISLPAQPRPPAELP
jgi:PAS domain S-box-containing protein